MRCFILTLATLLIQLTRLPGQWEILNEGTKGSLNTIDFVNTDIGWIAGEYGVLLKTEDGGQNWFSLPQDENWHICMLDFVNESTGWAVSVASDWNLDKEAIMKTTDGGQTWQIQSVIADRTNNWVGSIFAVDETVVYIVITKNYDCANIIKTSDGGATWQDISPNSSNRNFHSVWFFNRDTGIVVGNSYQTIGGHTYEIGLILRTEDGGQNWSEQMNSDFHVIRELQFVDDSTGFFISGSDLLFKTDNAFRTWPTAALFDSKNITSYHALDASTVYADAIGGGGGYWGVNHQALKSTDGGMNYENSFSINWNVSNIGFINQYLGFIIGAVPFGGNIFRTADGGAHWERVLLSYPFFDVHFIDKDNGIACGGVDELHFNAGNVLVTHDGGRTWKVSFNTAYVQKSCQFISDSVGFALSRGQNKMARPFGDRTGILSKTADGGNSWVTKPFEIDLPDSSVFTFYGMDLNFTTEKTGWAVGHGDSPDLSEAAIIRTIDGGERWELAAKYPHQNEIDYTLKSIHFIDSTTGWAVGDNGLIIKCNDGNRWEERAKITDVPLNKVIFIDENNGFIAGGYLNWDGEFQTILFKTTNGGEVWQTIPDFPYLIHDIYFHNKQHGWAVGSDKSDKGVIVESRDGGDLWTVQVDCLIGSLNSLSYRDGYLWAVGEYGLVLRIMADSTTGIDEKKYSSKPGDYKLFQNYPNPFNSTTVISYTTGTGESPLNSRVELSIYNLCGQKVKTLVSEKQSAGYYSIEWDASGFASGVYFYQLVTERGFTCTKKLVVLK